MPVPYRLCGVALDRVVHRTVGGAAALALAGILSFAAVIAGLAAAFSFAGVLAFTGVLLRLLVIEAGRGGHSHGA